MDTVAFFIRLPQKLAKLFPSLAPTDISPTHVTLLFLNEGLNVDSAKMKAAVSEFCAKSGPIKARLNGLNHFVQEENDLTVAHVKVEFDKDIQTFRAGLKKTVEGVLGSEIQEKWSSFVPHVTLAYLKGTSRRWEGQVPEGEWEVSEIEIWNLDGRDYDDPVIIPLGHMKKTAEHKKNVALMKWLSLATKQLGVARDTYVVGGAVRNFLINQPIKDVDLVIDSKAAGKDSDWLAERLSRLIPARTSLTTNQYGVAILTIKEDWILEGHNLKGETLEIANARKESYGGGDGKGYKPSEVEPATIEEDVLRREFTFNTLMWRLMDLAQGPDKAEIIDLTGCGVKDLRDGNIRCPANPDVVFADDPTRMLRALKFIGRYGFTTPRDVVESIRRNARKIKAIPWEAVGKLLFDEILNQPTARKLLTQMEEFGLLEPIAEMIQEKKPFAAFVANRLLTDRRVQFILDLMELGIPARTPLSFLSPADQKELRTITVGMAEDDAVELVEHLIKPPVDNMKVITTLNLPDRERGKILGVARELILSDPSLVHFPSRLTEQVIDRMSRLKTSNLVHEMAMRVADKVPPLGWPGGQCHVVKRIEKEIQNPKLEDLLSKKVELGMDLDNPSARQVYDPERTRGAWKYDMLITPHAQYRMDLRGITEPELRKALDSAFRDINADRAKGYKDRYEKMMRGGEMEFHDKKLNIFFAFQIKGKEAVIITVYRPGENDHKYPTTCR